MHAYLGDPPRNLGSRRVTQKRNRSVASYQSIITKVELDPEDVEGVEQAHSQRFCRECLSYEGLLTKLHEAPWLKHLRAKPALASLSALAYSKVSNISVKPPTSERFAAIPDKYT